MGRGIALLFHDRGTRRGWVVSSMPRPHFTPGKDPVPILQEAVWAPGPVWTGGKSRPHRDSILDPPARSSVAIPTELPGPHLNLKLIPNSRYNDKNYSIFLVLDIIVYLSTVIFPKKINRVKLRYSATVCSPQFVTWCIIRNLCSPQFVTWCIIRNLCSPQFVTWCIIRNLCSQPSMDLR